MSQNPIRDEAVRRAVELCVAAGGQITVENVAKYGVIPSIADFDLGDDDLVPYVEAAPVEQHVEPVVDVAIEPSVFSIDTEPVEAAPVAPVETVEETAAEPLEPTPFNIENAEKRVVGAEQDLADARCAVYTWEGKVRDRRMALFKAVSQFQSGLAAMTPDQLLRDNAKEQHAIRKAIADGTMPRPRRWGGIGKSRIDATAAAQIGGSPTGGGRAYARGAYPAHAYGRVVPRPPSDR
jgi:hypothetical protein